MSESASDRPSDQLTEGDIARKHGEELLAIFEEDAKRRQGADPLLETINQAHRARPEDDPSAPWNRVGARQEGAE